jgi:ligand-binding sensor domain-containing protein
MFENNNIWFTTMGHGAVKYNKKSQQLTHFTPKNNNAASLKYNAIVVYKGDVLLSVRDYGLLKYDQETNNLVPYFTGYSNSSEHVTGMLVKGDELWLGSIGKGIYRFHQDTLEQLTISDGMISSLSFTLALDGKGRVWVASDAGISIVNEDFSVERVLNQDHGLMGNAVWAMIFDGQKSMWVGGSDGLVQINIDDFKVRNFTKNDGIQDFEYNFGSAWLSPLGQIFIGGANGFNQFYPEKIPKQLEIPPLFLTEIDILGESFTQQTTIQEHRKNTKLQQSEYLQEINLNYQQDILSFKFSSLAYSHQQYLSYSVYRLGQHRPA